MSDLIFKNPPAANADLIFGSLAGVPDAAELTVNASFPALVATTLVVPVVKAVVHAEFPAFDMLVDAVYDSNTSRPTVGAAVVPSQDAVPLPTEATVPHQKADKLQVGFGVTHEIADRLKASLSLWHESTLRLQQDESALHENAIKVQAGQTASHHATIRTSRASTRSLAQHAIRTATVTGFPHQEAYRNRRFSAQSLAQVALHITQGVSSKTNVGVPKYKSWDQPDQQAMKPLPGITDHTVVVPPVNPPCYTPDPNLIFIDRWDGSPDLTFKCQSIYSQTVVVPIKVVYMVSNSLSITRLSDSRVIPCLTSTFSIDMESWTWGFSATIPYAELQYVVPQAGVPVEIAISCNVTSYRFVVEKISTTRSFGKQALSISGRGVSCYLDSPYAPSMDFRNVQDRMAQQLMEDALTENGQPIGWTINWNLIDWLVPAGVWAHQGSYISAINTIAQAAGGYVQADIYAKTLHILPRYANKPWEWGAVSPDYVLPSAVTKTEGIEWIQQPDYDAVYVSGESVGVLGYIKRTGFSGGIPAPMVVDKLITHSDAALQRGISVLANTGPQALVTLSLPVLPATGIITPGKYVEYVDGGVTHFGVVRSTSVDAKMPSITQTLGIETHV